MRYGIVSEVVLTSRVPVFDLLNDTAHEVRSNAENRGRPPRAGERKLKIINFPNGRREVTPSSRCTLESWRIFCRLRIHLCGKAPISVCMCVCVRGNSA